MVCLKIGGSQGLELVDFLKSALKFDSIIRGVSHTSDGMVMEVQEQT